MYFTDRGIEELEDRKGEESTTCSVLAYHMRHLVDLNPQFEIPVDRLVTWLVQLDHRQRRQRRIAITEVTSC